MSKLVVSGLRCVETTSGAGNDQIYMIVFRGSFNLGPDVKVIGGKNTPWGDMGTGKLVEKDMILDDIYHSENAYVVVLLEQDDNRDIMTGNTWSKVLEFWANHWTKFTGTFGREMCALTALLIGGAVDDDDLIGKAQSIPQIFKEGGAGVLLKFEGDGGRYRVRFVMRP